MAWRGQTAHKSICSLFVMLDASGDAADQRQRQLPLGMHMHWRIRADHQRQGGQRRCVTNTHPVNIWPGSTLHICLHSSTHSKHSIQSAPAVLLHQPCTRRCTTACYSKGVHRLHRQCDDCSSHCNNKAATAAAQYENSAAVTRNLDPCPHPRPTPHSCCTINCSSRWTCLCRVHQVRKQRLLDS
jgi:hypothetical protein